MGNTRAYQARLSAFAEALEIGVGAYAKHPPPDEDGLAPLSPQDDAREQRKLVRMAQDPQAPFANLRSLAYLEDAFFTFWNESPGPHAKAFWTAITERALPYARTDVVRKVLSRGRIRTRIEYEHVTDDLMDLRFSADERQELGKLLAAYEGRNGRKRK